MLKIIIHLFFACSNCEVTCFICIDILFSGETCLIQMAWGSWGLDVSVARPLYAEPQKLLFFVGFGVFKRLSCQEARRHDDTHTILVRSREILTSGSWSGLGLGTCSWWATQLPLVLLMQLLLYLQPRDGVSFTKVILCGNNRSLFSLSRHWQLQCQWRILVLSRACTFKPVRYCTARVSQFEEISDASSIRSCNVMNCTLHLDFTSPTAPFISLPSFSSTQLLAPPASCKMQLAFVGIGFATTGWISSDLRLWLWQKKKTSRGMGMFTALQISRCSNG